MRHRRFRVLDVTQDVNAVNTILARIELVATTLRLPDSEIENAMANHDGLIAFARRHHQSLAWLAFGDVRGMIARRAADRNPNR